MTDIALSFDGSEMRGDLCLVNGDLALDHGLGSLTVMSLMTDARATTADVPAGEDDLRGWWGDALADRPLGSRLWTLARAKTTPGITLRAADMARDALAWLSDDGIAEDVTVEASRINGAGSGATLGLSITITRPSGGTDTISYDLLWEAMR